MQGSLQNELDEERPFSEAPRMALGFMLPKWLRVAGIIILGSGLIGAAVLVAVYVWYEDKAHLEPAKLNLVELVIFCLLGLTIFLLPWDKYHVRIRKIGPIEFEEALSNQAREHAVDWHELRQRIEQLERSCAKGKVGAVAGKASKSNQKRAEELQALLVQFFAAYGPRAFSPVRITSWGARQPGFEKLSKHGPDEIRRALHALVAKGSLETTISRKGNTLYRLTRGAHSSETP